MFRDVIVPKYTCSPNTLGINTAMFGSAAILTRNSRLLPGLLGHWVGKLGWLVGWLVGGLVTWFVVYLLGWFGRLVGLLFGWPAGWWTVWLATWLEGGGLEVGTFLLLVGLVGWLPVLAGWFGSTRQRLVPSPGALTEGSGRGPVALKGYRCLGGPGCCKNSGAAFNYLF